VGLCPGIVLSSNLRFDFALTSQLLDGQGGRLFTSETDAAVTLKSVDFATPPCRVRGARALINGPLRYTVGTGSQVSIDASELQATAGLSDFQLDPGCDPGTITATLRGQIVVTDLYADPAVTVAARLDDLRVTWHRLPASLEISGKVGGDSFAGTVMLSTTTPLAFQPNQPCFSGGSLTASTSSRSVQLVYGQSGVEIDEGLDRLPINFDSCLAGPLRGGS
jgi:hypothetical protein